MNALTGEKKKKIVGNIFKSFKKDSSVVYHQRKSVYLQDLFDAKEDWSIEKKNK